MKNHYCKHDDLVAQLCAAERRLPLHHEARADISSMIRRELAGIRGQKALKFPLRFLELDEAAAAFHNLRLQDDNGHFEMDILIVSAHFLLILEVKNWRGTLLVDGTRQIVRIDEDGREEGMPHPLLQVRLQQHRLQNWLGKKYKHIPIFHYVVIGFPTTILKPFSPDRNIPNEIIHANELPWHVRQLRENCSSSALDEPSMNELGVRLQECHVPRQLDLQSRYNLVRSDFINGVLCPKCGAVPMTRIYGSWQCENCIFRSPDAHIPSLRDYQHLFGKEITNLAARQFLQISSPCIAKRLLHKVGAIPKGEKSRRIYYLDLLNPVEGR